MITCKKFNNKRNFLKIIYKLFFLIFLFLMISEFVEILISIFVVNVDDDLKEVY